MTGDALYCQRGLCTQIICFRQLDIDQGTPEGQDLYQRGRCLCYTVYLADVNGVGRWLTDQADTTFKTVREDVTALTQQFYADTGRLTDDPELSADERTALHEGQFSLGLRVGDEERRYEQTYLKYLDDTFIEPFRQKIRTHLQGCPPPSTTASALIWPPPDGDNAPPEG